MGFGPNPKSPNVQSNLQNPKSNQISNRSDPNRILIGQIESHEATQSRFKLNLEWDLPITGDNTRYHGVLKIVKIGGYGR